MPNSCTIYAFEPDPLNFLLLSNNIELNNATNITAIQKALSNKDEIKKLYQYKSKNLGRHSLLNINNSNYINVESVLLDDFLLNQGIEFSRVKFAKIDIEGYEFCSLLGAPETLKHLQCLITEFSNTYMKRGGIKPKDLTDLLSLNRFTPHLLDQGHLKVISIEDLLKKSDCDVIWLKQTAKK